MQTGGGDAGEEEVNLRWLMGAALGRDGRHGDHGDYGRWGQGSLCLLNNRRVTGSEVTHMATHTQQHHSG